MVPLEADLNEPATRLPQLRTERGRFLNRARQRLLDEHAHASSGERECIARVVFRTRRDHDAVQPFARSHGLWSVESGDVSSAAKVDQQAARLFERRRVAIANGDELDGSSLVPAIEILEVDLTHPTDAEGTDARSPVRR
jgi:hypothetical protein